MTVSQRRFLHLANVLVGVTGIVYFVFRYLYSPVDEFAIINHPWQPHMQHLHVLFAPLLVFAAALIWQNHAWSHWRRGVPKGRRTGIAMMLSLFPMIFSGYLLQVSVDDLWRQTWVIVHVATSVLWLGGYGVHLIGAKSRR